MSDNTTSNVVDFGDRLNFLVAAHNLQLHLFHSRYGDGEIAFLGWEEEPAERIIAAFTGGDGAYEQITKYFQDAKWFPIIYGATAIDAIDKLLEFLANDFVVKDTDLWRRAVERACSEFAYQKDVPPLLVNYSTYMEGW